MRDSDGAVRSGSVVGWIPRPTGYRDGAAGPTLTEVRPSLHIVTGEREGAGPAGVEEVFVDGILLRKLDDALGDRHRGAA